MRTCKRTSGFFEKKKSENYVTKTLLVSSRQNLLHGFNSCQRAVTLGFTFKLPPKERCFKVTAHFNAFLIVQCTEAGNMLELRVCTVHRGREYMKIKGPYSAPRQAAC